MKNLKHTRYANIQLIVFALFTIASALFLDSSLKSSKTVFVYISIAFYIIMLASLIYEAIKYKKHRPIARITVAIIFLLLALLMFNSDTLPTENESEMNTFELGGFVFLLSIWVIFLMSCLTNFILIRAYKREGEVDLVSGVVSNLTRPLKGFLPVGFFEKKHFIFLVFAMVLATLLPAGLFFYLQFVVFDNLLVNATILFVVLLTLYLIVVFIYARVSTKAFRIFERDLDFPSVIAVIDQYRANPKLHPETSNYLLLVKANYMMNYDPSLAESLWNEVSVPSNITYRLMYDLVYIERLTWKLDFAGAKAYILESLNTQKQARAKLELKRRLKMNIALSEGTSESEVAIMWPLNNKIKLLVIQNLAFRTLYYHLHSNFELAKTYFHELKALSPQSIGIIETIATLLQKPVTLEKKETPAVE